MWKYFPHMIPGDVITKTVREIYYEEKRNGRSEDAKKIFLAFGLTNQQIKAVIIGEKKLSGCYASDGSDNLKLGEDDEKIGIPD